MLGFDNITNELEKYNLLLYDINGLDKPNPSDFNINVQLSNNFAYPKFTLGFSHFIHQIKDNTKELNNFNNRKKVYLVTSLFEKSIDNKNIKNTDDEHIRNINSINDELSQFIKGIDKNFPAVLNRAFLKIWEMIVLFDLIPDDENFTSSHLAEGPGSFIQATILYRDFLKKNKKISTTKHDNYYGVTLFSDHDYLQMQKDFIKYIDKEKPGQLHIFSNTNVNKIDQMFGGNGEKDNIDNINYEELFKIRSNGDITKLNTILQFAGSKLGNTKGFSESSNLITADGGFDWRNENLQEQEAYKLIIGQIVTALKTQKNEGNFVIKIFESYTIVTVKLIEFLRSFYDKVYIYKPYTSRISNSEKYVVCKKFNKKSFTNDISNKLDLLVKKLNDNDIYDVEDIFTDFNVDDTKIKLYKNINISLLVKQYMGINNILGFIHLDNYNGTEYNNYLKKQIYASYFWNSLFLVPSMFNKLFKFSKTYNYLNYEFANNNIFINTENKFIQRTLVKEDIEPIAQTNEENFKDSDIEENIQPKPKKSSTIKRQTDKNDEANTKKITRKTQKGKINNVI
jgi:23S rRNA U2552 (ribose-2'-O)-methylase RlmE/FtsJ